MPNEFSRSRTASPQETEYNYKSDTLDSTFYVESKSEEKNWIFCTQVSGN
jgi:hypothetical protein